MTEHEEPDDDIELPESDEEFIAFTERLLEIARNAGISDEELEPVRQSHKAFIEACEESDRADRAATFAEAELLQSGKRLMEVSAKLRQQGIHVPGDPILPH